MEEVYQEAVLYRLNHLATVGRHTALQRKGLINLVKLISISFIAEFIDIIFRKMM